MSGIVPHTPFAYPRSVCSSCFYLLGGCKVWVGLFQICTSSFLIAHQLLTRDFWSSALSLLFLVYQACVSVSSFIAFPYMYYRLLYWRHPWSDQLQEADTLTFQIPLQFIFWSCSLNPSIYRCFKNLNFFWQYSYLEAGLQADSLKTNNPLGHPPKKLQFAYKCFS